MNTERERKGKEREKIENELIIIIRNQMERIYSVWEGYDLEMNIQTRRARIVWNHIQNLLKDVYVEENTFYELYKGRINNYKTKIAQLYIVLEMTPPEPVVADSWIVQEEMLSQELCTLTEIKRMRTKKYKELKNEELNLCQNLNLQEHKPPSNTEVPSEKDFLELKKQVNILNEEKERRQMKFDAARKELMTMLEVTEFLPESPLEEEIIGNKNILTLTEDTFKALESVTNKVQETKEEIEVKKKCLIESLTVFWQSQKVPENKRMEFLSKHADCRLSTLQSIEQEIEKCKAIKSGNCRPYILGLRTELAQLWEKCYVSQSEKDLFRYFYSTELSVEVLEAHKLEVDKWKKHFSKVKHILKKIDKRKLLWDTLHVMEEAANDPNRFRSSKRNLLHDSKKRKELKKDLPALENDIYEDIKNLKLKDGSTLLFMGEDFKTYVANQWSEINHKNESKKVEKHNKHLSQLGSETAVKTPLKRTLSVNLPKTAPCKLLRSKTLLYNGNNFKTHVSKKNAKSGKQNLNDSDVHKKHFVQKSKDVNFATPLKRTVTMNFSKTAPSKFFKTMSPFYTPTVNHSKVVPSTVARMASKATIRPAYLLQKKVF